MDVLTGRIVTRVLLVHMVAQQRTASYKRASHNKRFTKQENRWIADSPCALILERRNSRNHLVLLKPVAPI